MDHGAIEETDALERGHEVRPLPVEVRLREHPIGAM